MTSVTVDLVPLHTQKGRGEEAGRKPEGVRCEFVGGVVLVLP
jgi:hypothetical protein